MVNHVDALLSEIGNGKWNFFHFISCSIASGLLAPFAMAGSFVVPRLRHICRHLVPEGEEIDWNNANISDVDRTSCSYSVQTETEGLMEETRCNEWIYDDSTFTRTITSEFNLVCERESIRAIYMSLYMIGVLVASPCLGYVSDRFGRKRTFVVGVLAFIILSHISGWLPNIPSLLICRFLIGVTHVPVVKISFIIAMETATPQKRYIVGILMYLPWSILTIIFGGIAYLERDWRYLLTYISIIGLPLLPALWFIDESPHWLAVRGRYTEALKVFKKVARWNNSTLPPDEEVLYLLKEHSAVATKDKENEEKKKSWCSILREKVLGLFILFRTPRMRTISTVMHLGFFAIGMIYYGLIFSGGSFNIDIFSYMVLCGLTEVPSVTIVSPVVARFGRKWPFILGFLSTGVVLLCVPFVSHEHQWLSVTLSLIGRTTLCVASAVIYLYASELFPTEVRTRGVTYSFMMSRLGSSIAPFITEYLAYSYKWAPSVVFGGAAFIAGLVSMALWETKGTTLPDTIQYLENTDINAPKLGLCCHREKNTLRPPHNLDTKIGTSPEEKIQLNQQP